MDWGKPKINQVRTCVWDAVFLETNENEPIKID